MTVCFLFFLSNCSLNQSFIVLQVNHAYPGHIVMFRDGVSDGQLQFVKEYEVAQLISAFRLVEPPFEPKFTMVVVQKRINARFFLKQVGEI